MSSDHWPMQIDSRRHLTGHARGWESHHLRPRWKYRWPRSLYFRFGLEGDIERNQPTDIIYILFLCNCSRLEATFEEEEAHRKKSRPRRGIDQPWQKRGLWLVSARLNRKWRRDRQSSRHETALETTRWRMENWDGDAADASHHYWG